MRTTKPPGVNRRDGLTPPCLGKAMVWNADRRPDPMPSNNCGGKRHIRASLQPDAAGEEYAVCLSNEA